MDGPFFRYMEKAYNMGVLTFLWVICCIPVITAGASTSAVFFVTQRMTRDEESYVLRDFFRGFKINFKQATKLWLIFLPIGAFLAFDFYAYFGPLRSQMPTWGMPVLLVISFVYLMMYLYSFCMQSRYTLTIRQILQNSLILLIVHVKHTLLVGSSVILMAVLIVLFVTINAYLLFFSLILGPGLIFYVVSLFMMRVFDPLEKGENPEKKENESAKPDEHIVLTGDPTERVVLEYKEPENQNEPSEES